MIEIILLLSIERKTIDEIEDFMKIINVKNMVDLKLYLDLLSK